MKTIGHNIYLYYQLMLFTAIYIMKNNNITIESFVSSGILEMYVLGQTDADENIKVESMMFSYPAILFEINEISKALCKYGKYHGLVPDITIKPAIFSTIDFIERMKNGELPSNPPLLTSASKIVDYSDWLDRPDMILNADFEGIYAKVIAHNDKLSMAIIWLRDGSPMETHFKELESLLIIEGTCTITIDDTDHFLKSGDVIHIPLFKKHIVTVTSSIICKAILQRVAA